MTIVVEETDHGRFYTVDGDRFASVTTILDPLAAPGLVPWSGWLSAKTACEDLPRLVAAMRIEPCERTFHRHDHAVGAPCTRGICPCNRCLPCLQRQISNKYRSESSRRADEGRRVHKWVEHWVLSGGEHAPCDPDIRPYIDTFLQFVEAYGLTPESWLMCEAICVNRAAGYAGTTDGIIRFGSVTPLGAELVAKVLNVTVDQAAADKLTIDVIDDFKSREKEDAKFYPSQALQLSAYRWSPKVWIKNANQYVDMPDTAGAVLIQLRPDGFTVRPVVANEVSYQAFLAQKEAHDWLAEFGTASVSSRTFKPAKPLKAAKRAARKATSSPATTKFAEVPEAGTVEATGPKVAALFGAPSKTPHPDSPHGDEIPF